MAILNYFKNGRVLYLSESTRDISIHDNSILNCRLCVFHDTDETRTKTNDVLKLFGKTELECQFNQVVYKDVNPWIMYINKLLVVYFGEDRPDIIPKYTSTWTIDYAKWTNTNWKLIHDSELYYVADVKEPEKLFIFDDNTYHFECHVGAELYGDYYLTKYDYEPDVFHNLLNEKINADKKDIELQIEIRSDIERRKKMAGYCSICGGSGALYTVNPYRFKRIGDESFYWICKMCYDKMITSLIEGTIFNGENGDSDSEYFGEDREMDANGYEFIDLGLSVNWATCNIGSTKPEGTGLYFAWGETQGYKDAKSGKTFNWADYKLCNGLSSTMTKYCMSASYGTPDNVDVLEIKDDAAHVNMGGDWRMPTKEEFQELWDACDKTWTTLNGVNGMMFKLKVDNTKFIFFPATDNCNSGHINNAGNYGYYWSSSLYRFSGYSAYDLFFGEGGSSVSDTQQRYNGFNIRGVLPSIKKRVATTEDIA